MLEVTGGSMATLVGANKDVDWPSMYQSSALAAANAEKVEELSQQVRERGLLAGELEVVRSPCERVASTGLQLAP